MFVKIISAVACATALTVPSIAFADHHKHRHYGSYAKGGQKIIVSCYRGPWKEVIWDRPNAVFLDSLVAIGYDYSAAQAIGERVCRDRALVGNPSALKATMLRILRTR